MNKTGLEKMIDWLDCRLKRAIGLSPYPYEIEEAITKARQLLSEEQAQKHTDMTGILKEIAGIRDMLKVDMGYELSSVDMLTDLLSRYERAQEGK